MTTFSQAVDTLIEESRRPDLDSVICTYINATIRDVHFNKANNNLVLFKSNMFEAEAIATSDERFVIPLEAAHRFAKMAAVYFPDVGVYATERTPNSMFQFGDQIATRNTWYRTGDSIAVSGYGGKDSRIWLAWFEYPRRLTYYAAANRPATWNDETEQFTIASAYDTNDASRETALDLTTNWLLQRWPDLILEGGRAKLYKRLNDEGRMRSSYSAFESARSAMVAAETYESIVTFMR